MVRSKTSTKKNVGQDGTAEPGQIKATSQQSRFKVDTLDSMTTEIDLHDVCVSIGENEVVSNSHLRIKEGVRYALVGRNGSGKSTLLKALADGIIPGLSPSMRILLLSQIEDNVKAQEISSLTVLEHVVRGDKERLAAIAEQEALTKAVESTSIKQTQQIMADLKLEQRKRELVDAQLLALRRSGARGKDARTEEINAEARLKEAEEALERLDVTEPEPSIVNEAIDQLSDVQLRLDLLDSATAHARATRILIGLGFSQEMIEGPYQALSGGWRSRAGLATALLVKCDLLLLDEVSNFLDLESIIWLERYLTAEPRTLILTSHDQEFLNAVVEETIILRHRSLRYFEGTPAAFEVNERKERKHKQSQQETLDKKREHIEASIREGRASAKKTGDDNRMRMVKTRQKKLDERFGVETSAKGTRFKLNRDMAGYFLTNRQGVEMEALEPPIRIRIEDPEPLRTIGDLITFQNVSFKHPKMSRWLLADVNFTVEQGGRLAFIGANGHGKSTLAKLVMGELQPTKGSITRHPQMTVGYFSQHVVEDLTRESDNDSSQGGAPSTALSHFLAHFSKKGQTVAEADARKCLGSFGLKGGIASDLPLSQLSGGQKVRVALACLVFRPPSLLLLDEVTTHVDKATIDALARALKGWRGAIVIITHDRMFSRIVIEGQSARTVLADITGRAEDEVDSSSSSASGDEDSDEVTEAVIRGSKKSRTKGKTYRVVNGAVKLTEGGMAKYVSIVERKIAKAQQQHA